MDQEAIPFAMSIVCCAPYKEFVVLATDTRLIEARSGKGVVVSDDFKKLKHYGHGWIAGVGHVNTLALATRNLRIAEIQQTDKIRAVLDDAWDTELKPLLASNPRARQGVE